MAKLSTLFGGGIRSIQKGQIVLTSQTSNTATITAVDITKAFVLHGGAFLTAGAVAGVLIDLTNATTVTATAGASSTGKINFTVIEFL